MRSVVATEMRLINRRRLHFLHIIENVTKKKKGGKTAHAQKEIGRGHFVDGREKFCARDVRSIFTFNRDSLRGRGIVGQRGREGDAQRECSRSFAM